MLASVGVSEEIARSPTAGAVLRLRTTIWPSAWILRPPTGSARNQYVPGVGAVDRRDIDPIGVRLGPARDADRLEARRGLARTAAASGRARSTHGLSAARPDGTACRRSGTTRGSPRLRSRTSRARRRRPHPGRATAPRSSPPEPWSSSADDASLELELQPAATSTTPARTRAAASGRLTTPSVAAA